MEIFGAYVLFPAGFSLSPSAYRAPRRDSMAKTGLLLRNLN